jgi:hypothetical protein
MNWYKLFLESGKVQEEPNKYSWVRLDADKDITDIHKGYTETINEKDLYILEQEGNDWSYGAEDKPHITVKWKLDFDDPEQVIDILDKEEGGEVILDKIEVFDNDDNYDVLVILCESDDLQRLHKKLTEDLEIEDDYPECMKLKKTNLPKDVFQKFLARITGRSEKDIKSNVDAATMKKNMGIG